MKSFISKNKLIICIIIFALIRFIMTENIPITAFPSQIYDDDMMVNMAINIRGKKWLGEYTSNTLVKGPAFPMLLAIINFFGLSYISVMNLIYILSCIYFIYTIKDLFKSKMSLIVIYILLLFNPVSFAFWTLQRVYRNGITLSQVLLIIGSMFACYQRRNMNIKKIIPFSLIAGIALASLWLTREDGIWILPFVLVVIAIMVISAILKNKKLNLKIVAYVTPLIILVISLNIVRITNYAIYGVYTYNEINDGYFGKVLKTMYSINTKEDIQYVTVTRNKIDLMYKNSKTLNSIKEQLEQALNDWDNLDRKPGDKQVEDGWFWWALKSAVENAGMYENAKKSNEFYKQVYEELKSAIKEGKLETGFSMPSNLLSPWKMRYFSELPVEMLKTSWYISNFNEIETVNRPSEEQSQKYNAITNDTSIQSGNDYAIYTNIYVQRLNFIGKLYKICGLMLTIISIICYIILTIYLIKIKRKEEIINIWLLLTGIGCSLLVLIAGVSYNQITSCFSRYYMYLSGAYPLLIGFWGISISKIVEILKKERK